MSSIYASHRSLFSISIVPVFGRVRTIIFAPATKVFVEIKRRFAMPQLYIREPFRDNV